MPQKICVYTCITGDYDNLHEIKNPEKNIDYYCFSNNPKLKSNTWQIIQISDPELDNCRLARKIKILGHEKINSYDIAVWTDACIIWQTKISDFIKTYLGDAPFAVFKHFRRTNIHDEAGACLFYQKDSQTKITRTLDFLASEHFPDNLGLFETTVFIKKPQDPVVIQTMELWFNLIKKYSRRDQLSLPYAVWKTKLKISLIDLIVWNNPLFSFQAHNNLQEVNFKSTTKYCKIYYGDPEHNFSFPDFFNLPFSKNDDTFSISHSVSRDTKEIYLVLPSYAGIEFNNFKFTPTFKTVSFLNSFDFKNHSFLFSNFSAVKVSGNFKKGQKLSFSIDFHPLSQLETLNLLQQLIHIFNNNCQQISSLNQTIAHLNHRISELNSQVSATSQILHDIENSRSYKLTQKLHNLFK